MKYLYSLTLGFLFFLLTPLCISAQTITWEKTYNRASSFIDGIECSVMDDSGNFVLAGWTTIPPFTEERLWVLKIKPNGDTLWTRMMDIRGYALSIIKSGDGGFVITGIATQAFAVKIDANGYTVWQRFYTGVGVQFERIMRTKDNGFILCGIYDLTNPYAIEINSDGSVLRQCIFLQIDGRFFDVKETSEGNYILCGIMYLGNGSKSFLVMLDSQLNPMWSKSFSIDVSSSFRDIHEFDGGYILFGLVKSGLYDSETMFTRVKNNGDSISYHRFVRPGSELSPNSIKLSENRLAYTATLDSGSSLIGIAKTVDTSGSVLAYGRYPFRGYSELYTVTQATLGDFLIAGITSPSETSKDVFGYAVRVDSLLRFKPMSYSNNSDLEHRDKESVIVYPNPFNSTINISFKVADPSAIEVSVYDLSGRKLLTIIDRTFPTGEHSTSINTSELNLASGTYFLILKTNGKSNSSLKIIHIK